jgi:cation transport ATPase
MKLFNKKLPWHFLFVIPLLIVVALAVGIYRKTGVAPGQNEIIALALAGVIQYFWILRYYTRFMEFAERVGMRAANFTFLAIISTTAALIVAAGLEQWSTCFLIAAIVFHIFAGSEAIKDQDEE